MENDVRQVKQLTIFIILSVVLITAFILSYGHQAEYGYYKGSGIVSHIIYPFLHANIFHLLGNMLALYFMCRHTKSLFIAYIIAIISSFIAYSSLPTIGLSGVVYACVGLLGFLPNKNISKAAKGLFLSYIVIGLIIPSLNGTLHLCCVVIGSILFSIKKWFYERRKDLRGVIR
jgi:membrane associated rhomboid family serine protease